MFLEIASSNLCNLAFAKNTFLEYMPERSFDDFDPHAKHYRDIHSENVKISGADSFYFAEMKVSILGQYESNIELQVLDVGCGDGVIEFYMNDLFPSWKLNGIDISAESIAIAKEKNIPNCNFQLYDGKRIPFPDNSFDIVFIAGVLHHVDFRLHRDLLMEVKRVLRDKGRLYLFEHNPLNPFTRQVVKDCVFDTDARLLRYGYAKKLVRDAGLGSIQGKFILFFPRKGWLSRLIKIERKLAWLPLGAQYYLRAEKVRD